MKLSTERVEVFIDVLNGGRIASFKLDGHELLVTAASRADEWGCYPMAPWAGRIRNGRFNWQSHPIQLPLRLPPALHGTVLDTPWQRIDENCIETDLGPSWPWGGRIRSVFRLDERALTWAMTVSASSADMPVTLGWHPWFLRRLESGSVGQLSFQARQMYERGSDGIVTGQRIPPSDGPWDDCFYDVIHPVRMTWCNGLALTIESSCQHWVIYDIPDHAILCRASIRATGCFSNWGL